MAAAISQTMKAGRVWLKQALVLGALAATVLILLACGGGEATTTTGPLNSTETNGTVEGLVVEVVGRNIVELESLGIRVEDGTVWTFTAEGPLEFSPSHLREHQLFGETVTVSYVRRGDVLVAVEIGD